MKKYVRYLLVLLMCSSLTGVKAQTTFPFDGIRYCLDGSEAQVFDGRYYSESKLIIPNSVWYNGIKYPVTSIRYHAFYECKSLTEVTIPNSVTTIGNGAFDSCTGLQKVIWNARNIQDPQIFNQPFSGCDRLTDFVFGEEVEYIPNYLCFQLTSLKKLVIGNSVTTIGMWAFYECTGLTEVTISNSVTTIGYKAFDGCTGLQKVIWNARNAQDLQYVYDNPIFPDCNQLTDFVFGEEVEHIPDFLCNNLRLLNTIVIPNSVTTIGQLAFNSCTGLQKVTIGNSVTTIGERAFSECRGLQKVTIGNSVTTIGKFAFTSCTGLQKVTIGNSVTAIGYGAFYSCTGLTEVIWNARNAQDFQDNSSPFSGCDRLTDFVFGEKVEHIPAYLCYQLASLKKLVIGNSVTSIGKMAFSSCTGLTEVTIPNSVTTIEGYAFTRCTGLKTVTIGNSVTTIEDGAFNGCTQMESVTIGEKVESIGESAFAKCNNLTAVISKAMTPPQIWATTFDDYAMTLYVPAGCKPKYAEAEYWNNFTDIRETGVTLHTVTANATDETMGYVTGGGEYPQGSTATLIAVPFGQNYFVRWNDGNTDNPRTITVTGNMTFTAEFAPAGSAVETLENGERGIYATGRTLHVENGGESYRVYTAAGRLVYTGNDSSVTLSAPGMYIVRTGDRSQKVAVK